MKLLLNFKTGYFTITGFYGTFVTFISTFTTQQLHVLLIGNNLIR